MHEDSLKKVAPFVFKNEILILVAVLSFIGLKYLHFPGRNIISIIGLSTIAGLYYISALYKQNNKVDSQLLFYKISGMSSGIIIIGIFWIIIANIYINILLLRFNNINNNINWSSSYLFDIYYFLVYCKLIFFHLNDGSISSPRKVFISSEIYKFIVLYNI